MTLIPDTVKMRRGRRIIEILKLKPSKDNPFLFETALGNNAPLTIYRMLEELMAGNEPGEGRCPNCREVPCRGLMKCPQRIEKMKGKIGL